MNAVLYKCILLLSFHKLPLSEYAGEEERNPGLDQILRANESSFSQPTTINKVKE
jgi:hypothetical protein